MRSYKLRVYPNKDKAKEVNKLIAFWRDEVNHKLALFWKFEEIRGSYPPKEYTKGGRIIRDASLKAWQIAKGSKKTGQEKRPHFSINEIDLNQCSAKIIEGLETKEFDLWLNVISLDSKRGKSKRLKLPCRKHRKFNKAMESGVLRKSFKINREGKKYYATFFFEFPEAKKENKSIVGIDVGMNHPAVASNGMVFGDELKDLRIKTKWRRYERGLSAYKQRLNRIAKEIIDSFPMCDFVVEKLLFKGKGKRSKRFRRNNNNWSYAHLSHKLEEMGRLEGFQLIKVNPAYTSVTCPVCGFMNKSNRPSSDVFKCGQCGYTEDADCVGALNLALKSRKEHPSLELITPKSFQCSSINFGGD